MLNFWIISMFPINLTGQMLAEWPLCLWGKQLKSVSTITQAAPSHVTSVTHKTFLCSFKIRAIGRVNGIYVNVSQLCVTLSSEGQIHMIQGGIDYREPHIYLIIVNQGWWYLKKKNVNDFLYVDMFLLNLRFGSINYKDWYFLFTSLQYL